MALINVGKKGKAAKRKQPLTEYSDTEGTTKDEEEPSLKDMMANIGAMLTNLTTRMEPRLRLPPIRQPQDESLPDQYQPRHMMLSQM